MSYLSLPIAWSALRPIAKAQRGVQRGCHTLGAETSLSRYLPSRSSFRQRFVHFIPKVDEPRSIYTPLIKVL